MTKDEEIAYLKGRILELEAENARLRVGALPQIVPIPNYIPPAWPPYLPSPYYYVNPGPTCTGTGAPAGVMIP